MLLFAVAFTAVCFGALMLAWEDAFNVWSRVNDDRERNENEPQH